MNLHRLKSSTGRILRTQQSLMLMTQLRIFSSIMRVTKLRTYFSLSCKVKFRFRHKALALIKKLSRYQINIRATGVNLDMTLSMLSQNQILSMGSIIWSTMKSRSEAKSPNLTTRQRVHLKNSHQIGKGRTYHNNIRLKAISWLKWTLIRLKVLSLGITEQLKMWLGQAIL